MKVVKTNISWGYLSLIEIFAKANNLTIVTERYTVSPSTRHTVSSRELITISYEEDSDTDTTITWLSFKHLGFENMLCDYLIKCGIDPIMIPVGRHIVSRSSKELDDAWEKQRSLLGFR